MARLTGCRDCGYEVSKYAEVCPKCGAPLKKTSGCMMLIILAVSFFIAAVLLELSKSTGG